MSKPSKVMNLNSLLMGADTVKPESKKSPKGMAGFVKPPTMKSLANIEKASKKVTDKGNGDTSQNKASNQIANGLSKLFDKAEQTRKVQDDKDVKQSSFGLVKMSPGAKRPKTAQANNSRTTSAFGKRSTAHKDSDDSQSESGSSSSRSESEDSENNIPLAPKSTNNILTQNQLIASDSDLDSDEDAPPQVAKIGKFASQASNKAAPLMKFNQQERKSKEKSEKKLTKLIEKPYKKSIHTPMIRRRKVLVTGSSEIPSNKNKSNAFKAFDLLNKQKNFKPESDK